MKTCNNAQCPNANPQPYTNFFKDKNNKTDGRYSICKTCKQAGTMRWREAKKSEYNTYMREYRTTHPEKYELGRTRSLRNRYGLTQAQYDGLLAKQGGTCALCPAKPVKRLLHVDHCHATGINRGLLCASHNRSIAILDDSALLERAVAYITCARRSYSNCDFCAGLAEGYMLNDSVWKAVTENTHEKFLCLACVESRLQRPLQIEHFTDAPLNHGALGFDCREYLKNKELKKIA